MASELAGEGRVLVRGVCENQDGLPRRKEAHRQDFGALGLLEAPWCPSAPA